MSNDSNYIYLCQKVLNCLDFCHYYLIFPADNVEYHPIPNERMQQTHIPLRRHLSHNIAAVATVCTECYRQILRCTALSFNRVMYPFVNCESISFALLGIRNVSIQTLLLVSTAVFIIPGYAFTPLWLVIVLLWFLFMIHQTNSAHQSRYIMCQHWVPTTVPT